MRLTWWLLRWRLRSPEAAAYLRASQEEIEKNRREIETNRQDIAGVKPIVDEATRRTNESFIAVERVTERARIGMALVDDLTEGWHG